MSLVFLNISDAIEADFNRNIQGVKGKIWMLCSTMLSGQFFGPRQWQGAVDIFAFPSLKSQLDV